VNTVSAPRRAGSLNRVYWYLDQMVNANSCEWIEIDGRLDIDMLQEAARIVACRHPVLNSRLRVGRLWRLDWVEDVGNLPIDIRVERLSIRTPAEIHDRLVANVWGERLPLRTGRPFRLHVTELETITVLQVITTHVFTDGHAANLVVRDLVRAYHSLHSGQPWVPMRFDVENRSMVKLFTAHLPIKERIRLTFKALCAIMWEAVSDAGRLGESSQPRTMTDIVMLDLGPLVFANVRRAAAKMGNSRHPLYVAAALRAIEDFNMKRGIQPSGRVLKIIDNFSLRRFASQDLTDLYDLCSLPYSLKVNGAFDDETLICNVSAQIEELRNGEILMEVFRQIIYKASTIFLPSRQTSSFPTSARYLRRSSGSGTRQLLATTLSRSFFHPDRLCSCSALRALLCG
jgi:hypothetical protein